MTKPRSTEQRLVEHVDRIAEEHPPIDLGTVDFSIRDPVTMNARFGHVLDYMARVELEVDRNVLELTTMLPDPPEVDRYFYADVWSPQEIRHGQILDELQVRLGRDPARADLTTVSAKMHVLGALSHIPPIEDVVRMLYYLTGQATERSAVLAYNLLHNGLTELGETAAAETIVAQIKRQEPAHHAFYSMSARGLNEQLAPWQRWLVRRLRALSFAPVGANNPEQTADFGDLILALGIDHDLERFSKAVARVEAELLSAADRGLAVPEYVLEAFRNALEVAHARRGADGHAPSAASTA